MNFISPEYKLLLLCCSLSCHKSTLCGKINWLSNDPDFDWQSFLNIVTQNRVLPIVYNALKQCKEQLPENTLEQFQKLYQKSCATNLLLTGHLIRVYKLLQEHNIVAVPFKGPVLSKLIYADVCFRSYGDIDILISKKDLPAAICLLEQNGYELDTDLPTEYYLKLVYLHHHANLISKSTGVSIELHWEATGRYLARNIALEFWQKKLEKVELNGVEVSSVGKEDQFVYLCVHANRHCWNQLEYIRCIAIFKQKFNGLDWTLIHCKAEQLGARRIVMLGLMLADSLFDTGVPGQFAPGSRQGRKLEQLCCEIAERLFHRTKPVAEEQLELKRLFFHYHTLDRAGNALRYGFRKLCIPDAYDVHWIRLPTYLMFLYVIIRPFRFIILSVKSRL